MKESRLKVEQLQGEKICPCGKVLKNRLNDTGMENVKKENLETAWERLKRCYRVPEVCVELN